MIQMIRFSHAIIFSLILMTAGFFIGRETQENNANKVCQAFIEKSLIDEVEYLRSITEGGLK